MDGPSLPLNVRRLLRTNLVVNRLHMFVNGIAILALFHYRVTTLVRVFRTRDTPLLPYLIVLVSEIVLTFLWVLHQAYNGDPLNLRCTRKDYQEMRSFRRWMCSYARRIPAKSPPSG
ncbi:UNVERIFIED_CONTAM: hypothetical protein Slati_1044900 [Sesamum latifolium]|uniref:Very-long-chain 3-oxoacyl-CoA synthase n=1 Tax=Sesamum latifolium TaxID=2727402 RepID=A0AAW2XSP3_9LAMI